MVIRRIEDCVAYQFAVEFRREVYRLVDESPEARRHLRFVDQLLSATDGVESSIHEGFLRRNPGEFVSFLRYALASLGEAKGRVENGTERHYFTTARCERTLTWARRCRGATLGLLASQRKRAALEREMKRKRNGTQQLQAHDRRGFIVVPAHAGPDDM
jgi:four helix bundle protein